MHSILSSSLPGVLSSRIRDFITRNTPLPGGAGGGRGPAGNELEFEGLALEVFEFQRAHNPGYASLLTAAGLTSVAPEHWSQIPPVPTQGFKGLEMTTLQPEDRVRVFHSSGTTDQVPSRHYHSPLSLELYETSLLAGFRQVLPEGTPEMLFLTPDPHNAPHSSLCHMFGVLRHAMAGEASRFAGQVTPEGVWELDRRGVMDRLRSAETSGRPLWILGTAFNFVHLLEHLQATDARVLLPAGSRALETGGYKGRSKALPKDELHDGITRGLGIEREGILGEYGMSELSSQAYACAGVGDPRPPLFRFPPWARARVVSPEDGREVAEGEVGVLRVVDLANLCSALSIQTEDLAVRRAGGFELVGRIPRSEPRGCSWMSAP